MNENPETWSKHRRAKERRRLRELEAARAVEAAEAARRASDKRDWSELFDRIEAALTNNEAVSCLAHDSATDDAYETITIELHRPHGANEEVDCYAAIATAACIIGYAPTGDGSGDGVIYRMWSRKV